MALLASIAAAAIYLVPVVVILAYRARRDTQFWEMALDVPLVVSVDLLSILLLARIVTLEQAAIASRVGWLAAAVGLAWARRGSWKGRWPEALGRREVLSLALTSVVALLISLSMSRPYAVWDRRWHIGLVTSIRGQSLPLMNVYEPTGQLYYHYAGDALAAVLQTFSLDVMHSSLALSLAHDITYLLLGLTLALLFLQIGRREIVTAALSAAAMLLMGPVTFLLTDGLLSRSGHSLVNLLSLSFRPHVSLAQLLMVGFVATILVRLDATSRGAPAAPARTAAPLLACTALLTMSDEASLALLGVALGVAWLFEPNVLHPRRVFGLGLLVGLASTIACTMWILSGTMAPGAPDAGVEIVSWRWPGFVVSSVSLNEARSFLIAASDTLPVLAAALAAAIVGIATHRREIRTLALFYGALATVTFLVYCRLRVGATDVQSHRFMTAALFLAPLLLVVLHFGLSKGGGLRARVRAAIGLVCVVAVGLSAFSTVVWLLRVAPAQCAEGRQFWGDRDRDQFYNTDCRRTSGARLLERPEPTYVATDAWYAIAGCRPFFAPGRTGSHGIKVDWPVLGIIGLAKLHQMLPPNSTLRVLCSTNQSSAFDSVCAYAQRETACEQIGDSAFTRCRLTDDRRQALLASLAGSLPPW
jgi:hypothetical protein